MMHFLVFRLYLTVFMWIKCIDVCLAAWDVCKSDEK